jgi:pimeloyl-ACP methyl ester carboxylesterase
VRLCGGSIFARWWGSEDAPVLLCWHGAGGSSADYAAIAPPLADRLGVRIVAVDAPGHARSPALPADAFRPTALAALAAEILDELGVERAAFLGFSWGATVGCWLAALHPDRTSALVLVEGGHVDFTDLPDFPTDLTLDDLLAEARAEAKRQGGAFGSHTPEVAAAMIHGLCAEPAAAAYSRLAGAGTPTLFGRCEP